MTDFADRAPYARLTPHQMLDALAAAGFPITGGLIQLNSYENRVVQAALEGGDAVVAKFYRPRRWNDAQILEEHAVRARARGRRPADRRAAGARVAVRATRRSALVGDPPTLGHWQPEVDPDDDDRTPSPVYRFGVAPRRAGRAPELESPHTLAWLGRLLGRLHTVGARRPFEHRRTLDCDTYGTQAIARVEHSDLLTRAQSATWLSVARQAVDAARRPSTPPARCAASACTATAIPATSCGARKATSPARCSSTSTTPAWARRCRTCGCCCPATATRCRASCPTY